MNFGIEIIENAVRKVADKEMRYPDTIIIGDNSSGKSEMLRRLIGEINKARNVYFIDAVNRNFSVKDIFRIEKIPPYQDSILKTRLDTDYFNLLDSFNCYGTNVERIEIIYTHFETEVQILFEELTGMSFTLLPEDVLGRVSFSEGNGLLSSGYQAIVRILLELLYFQKMGALQENQGENWVIIDELDEFLSPRYAGKIWGFLKKKFPDFYFVVTTHSCDLVVHAYDANLLVLTKENYEVWDINDYDSSSSVQIIFDRVFGKEVKQEDAVFLVLRNLFSKKINGVWSEIDESKLKEIDSSKLTASQKLIYKQIVEWY